MQPDFHINEPKSGEKLKAAWGANVVKSINALQPSVGYGLRVSRNLNGVLYELDEGLNGKGKGGFDMPFDVFFDHYDEVTHKLYINIKHGQVYYNLGASTVMIPPLAQTAMDTYEVDNIVADHDMDIMLGLIFNYDDSLQGDGSFYPENWQFGAIPFIEDEAYADSLGIKYYPIFRIKTNNKPSEPPIDWEGDNKYPVKWTFDVKVGDDSNHFLGIQLYHGNVWLSYSDGACFLAEIGSETQVGEYTASILNFGDDSGGTSTVRINVTELAFNDTLPQGSRVIAHPVYLLAYDSDSSGGY